MDVQLKDIQIFLEGEGYECIYIDSPKGDYLFIDIYINEEVIRLKLIFPSYFPYEFPKAYILKEFYNLYQPLPHINLDGHICTFDNNKVFPNSDKPKEVTLEVVRQAENVLIEGINGINNDDFEDEFLAYWELDSNIIVDLIFTPSKKVQTLWCYRRNETFMYISDSKTKLNNFLKYTKNWNIAMAKFIKVLYLPIENGFNIPFPTTNSEIINFLQKESHFEKYMNYMRDNESNRIVICSQEIKGSLCTFGWVHEKEKTPNGFRINNINPTHLYKNIHRNRKIKNVRVNQLGHKRIFNRGGDGTIQDNIKVSITGCGSIGSNLAKSLVDIGIKDLVLIDEDILTQDNIGRHYCGASYIRRYKSEAVKNELIRHYVDIKCTSINKNVFDVIKYDIDIFNSCNYNFIVVGNLPVERKFISLFNKEIINKPIILIWVEPYLIGGHAIIMQASQDIENVLFDEKFNFKDRIIINGDDYINREAGCQSTFIPYSGFEVQYFITNIVDFININFLEKCKQGNYLLSWSGRIDKARKDSMQLNNKWLSSAGRELKIRKLDSYD
ncbi:TPA: ThiF family adenylyltransferase [Clostridioides difficile]|nr:ThiF family adenylyltransferase [Clostridioides difficile]